MLPSAGLIPVKNAVAGKVTFNVPNLASPNPGRGTGAVTYTRASSAYVPDFEGRIVKVVDNSPSYPGLRAATNLYIGNSASVATWNNSAGATHSANTMTFTANAGDAVYKDFISMAVGKQSIAQYKLSGSGTVRIGQLNGAAGVVALKSVTLTATPTWYATDIFTSNNAGVGSGLIIQNGADAQAKTITIESFQYEEVGGSNLNPSEYVSTTSAARTVFFDYPNPNTVDGNGVVTDSGVRTPAYVGKGLLSEPAGTSIFANPLAPATQSITVTAQAYTLSFYGTGSIVRSGTSSGTLAGTGATDLVQVTFTPTAGSLTLTLSGSVTSPQLEAGTTASSRMLSSGVTSTRAATSCGYATSGNISDSVGSMYVEFTPNVLTSLSRIASGAGGIAPMFISAASKLSFFDGTNTVASSNSINNAALNKALVTWIGTAVNIYLNGTQTSGTFDGSLGLGATLGMGYDIAAVQPVFNGYLKQINIYPTVLAPADAIRITA